MKLVIFDLDQTLVDFIQVHDEAVRRLFRQRFGVDARLTEIDFAGRSLAENFLELARRKGIPAGVVREKERELLEAYDRLFEESIPADPSGHILPGVTALLEALSHTGNVVALYTGDSPGIVARVLQATGLGRYFHFCLYGTEVKARADMVKLAKARAETMTGRKFDGKDTVIIGDSVRDIECGQQFDALTIAVSTGFHLTDELLQRGPDYLFADLSDYRRVLAAIESKAGAKPVLK
ncbi:MAG: HAD family hydrolase [Chloroflexi bacterium]|nr:HAD family hydrolase [Chloroflexota bacterium]